MVCLSCQVVVRSEIEKLNLRCITLETGWLEVDGTLSNSQVRALKTALLKAGLELIDDRKAILVEAVKNAILELLNDSDLYTKTNFSYYLSEKLDYDYTYLANIFSEMEGATIENFIITNKIRRVKELICYKELSLTEISWKMNYSSVAHLSTQFKKVTGVTPSEFRRLACNSPLPSSMCEL